VTRDPVTCETVALADAVRRVAAGGLVAFPTETVWGLGADATSARAVARLRAWKGRDADRPVALLVEALDAAEARGVEPTPLARCLAAAFWPGPLTLVVPAPRARFAPGVAGADGAVGLRCSPEPTAVALARALARAGVGPLTATSLNRAGEPPARSLAEARALCNARPGPQVVAPLAGAEAATGEPVPVPSSAPSTVVDCTGPGLRLIREGAIPAHALAEAALHQRDDAPQGVEATR